MSKFLLSMSFLASSVGAIEQVQKPVEEQLLLNPVSEISFCGEIPIQMNQKMIADVSNFSFCFKGQDRIGSIFNCKVPIKKPPLWSAVEEAFEKGQNYPDGGRIGKLLVPAVTCQEMSIE